MKPGILPTVSGVYQHERKQRLRAAAGTLATCSVCSRQFARELRGKLIFGPTPAGFIAAPLCSITCRERAVAKSVKDKPCP